MNLFHSVAVSVGLALGVAQCEPAPDTGVPAPIPGRCTQYESLLAEHAPPIGWDVVRMSKYMYRESNCQPAVRSRTSDTGLLQINDINLQYLRQRMGEWVDRWTLTDPVQNIRAAAQLCTFWAVNGRSCYQAWAT